MDLRLFSKNLDNIKEVNVASQAETHNVLVFSLFPLPRFKKNKSYYTENQQAIDTYPERVDWIGWSIEIESKIICT